MSRAESRLEPVRRRAALVKRSVAVVGAVGFGLTMVLARASYAGHSKQPPGTLAAPPRFVEVVRQNLLQAGIVAPAATPPDAATSVS